jgi:hypothetical protein
LPTQARTVHHRKSERSPLRIFSLGKRLLLAARNPSFADRLDVVASRAALGKGFERHKGHLGAVDMGSGDFMARFLGDLALEPEEISFRERAKADLIFFHAVRFSPVLRDAWADA